MVISESPAVLKSLLCAGQSKMLPTDILLALHSLDHTKDGVKLKQIMAALDHCLSLRAKFDKSVLATVLQNLIQRPTLPPLYMRFMMQAQAAIPTLKSLIVHQLSTLVNEQIWTNKSLFLGWNLAVRQNVPESFPAFLQVGIEFSLVNCILSPIGPNDVILPP